MRNLPFFNVCSVFQHAAYTEPKAVCINSEPRCPEDGTHAAIHQDTGVEAKLDIVGENEGKSDIKWHGGEVSVGQTADDNWRGVPREQRSNTFGQLQQEVHNKRKVGMR